MPFESWFVFVHADTHFFGHTITDIPRNTHTPGGVFGAADPIVYGLSSGGACKERPLMLNLSGPHSVACFEWHFGCALMGTTTLHQSGYGDWKCCSQLPHSCYDELPKTCGGKGTACQDLLVAECGIKKPPLEPTSICLNCTTSHGALLKQAGCEPSDYTDDFCALK